jgi:hypothetical protein
MIVVHVVEMAVVEIVQMASVANRGMPAVRAMLMRMVGMVLLGAGGHDFPLLLSGIQPGTSFRRPIAIRFRKEKTIWAFPELRREPHRPLVYEAGELQANIAML